MNYESFPRDIVKTELICALRFDGYAYGETSGLNLGNLPTPILETGKFYEDSLKTSQPSLSCNATFINGEEIR